MMMFEKVTFSTFSYFTFFCRFYIGFSEKRVVAILLEGLFYVDFLQMLFISINTKIIIFDFKAWATFPLFFIGCVICILKK